VSEPDHADSSFRQEEHAARTLPARLWEQLRADPVRAPEYIALAASEFHAPAAEEWVSERRAMYAHTPAELARMARKRHSAFARVTGAATGFGGFVTMIPDLASLAWIQSRVVFFIAAAYGYDPHDPMRPAELLVIERFHPDPATARAALDGVGTTMAEAFIGRSTQRDRALFNSLARYATRKGAKKLAGKAIPGLAVVVNSFGNARAVREVADRAIEFYGG